MMFAYPAKDEQRYVNIDQNHMLLIRASTTINLAERAFKRFRSSLGKIHANLFGTSISDAEFRKSLLPEFAKPQDFLDHFKEQRSRSFFFGVSRKSEIIDSLRQACPDAEQLILTAANRVCEHYFDLLGSGLVSLGWPIDWHTDFKTGFRWNPRQYYAEIRPAACPGGYDLKIPWELSRCQHFVWLGQGYWLTGDEKYAREFRSEVEDWVRQNPPELGVNWACSMDIAIRAVNWLWGYAFFQESTELDDDFRITFCKSLLCHGRHIRANLERTAKFTGNHYLSDIVGLIYLGILLPELKEAKSWREFGLKELENEMFSQVYPDGGDFESSTSYHRLVTELFLSATLLARLNGHALRADFHGRLEQMLEFIYRIMKPDGTIPIIGDQDNGRLHRLKIWEKPEMEWNDFRPLLAVGSVFFHRPDWGKMAGRHWEEAIWLCGKDALNSYQQCSQHLRVLPGSIGFRDSGLYILRSDDMYVAVDLGSIGQNGVGGHAHNDTLSFELFASGQTWIQDPGTYVYTSDYGARNLFRSTAFHNTVVFPHHEQNCIGDCSLFSMTSMSISRLTSWIDLPNSSTVLSGELKFIKDPRMTHVRSFFLNGRQHALIITDSIDRLSGMCRVFFHFASGVLADLVEQPYMGIRLTHTHGQRAWLFSVSPGSITLKLSEGFISESYGRRVPSKIAYFEHSELQHKMVIISDEGLNNVRKSVEKVLEDEESFLRSRNMI